MFPDLSNQVATGNAAGAAPVQNTGFSTPAAASSGGGSPAFNSIQNDALYQQGIKDLQAASASDRAGLTATTQRLLIQAGIVPDVESANALGLNLNFFNQDVTPGVVGLAKGNKLSMAARLDRALRNTQQQNRLTLRQRSAVRSGEKGHLAQQAQTGFDEATYDLVTRLFDSIIQAQGGYLSAEQQRAWQKWQLALLAAQNQQGLGNTGGPQAPGGAPQAPGQGYQAAISAGYTPGDDAFIRALRASGR